MTKRKNHIAVRSLAKYSLLTLPILIAIYLYSLTRPVASKGDLVTFSIEKGQSAGVIARNLQAAGLIRSPLYFRMLVRLYDLTLQAGVYQLSPSSVPDVIAEALTAGRLSEQRLLIPEGYRLEQIAEVVEKELGIDKTDFLKEAAGQEGYLFPDTYLITKDASAKQVVSIMRGTFDKKFGKLEPRVVILASLIERETKGKEEKGVVAGILQKRLEAGWALELDATVQYVMGDTADWWPVTTLADREVKSKYNTYLAPGLPPGPIAAPGADSINAALHPVSSDYWFYLHDRDGVIRYARTNAEHTANIQKYLY